MKILILNPFGVGDVLFATPMVEVIKRHDPQNRIGFICNRRVVDVLETNPYIDELFVFEKDEYRALWKQSKLKCVRKIISFLRTLRRRRFDVVIDLSLNGQYNFFLRFLGIPARVGLDYRRRGKCLTRRIVIEGFDEKSIAEYYLDTVRAIGIPEEPKGVQLFLKNEDFRLANHFLKERGVNENDCLIGIVPGGGVSFGKQKIHFKRWDVERYIGVARQLVREPATKVLILCAPDEHDLTEAFRPYLSDCLMCAPPTTLRQMAAFMKRCRVVLANDAGPLHLAVGVGVPSVSVFGPTDERVYGPYSKNGKHRVVTSAIECRPCYKRFRLPSCDHRRCLSELKEEEVLSAVKSSFEKGGVNL